jgi:hypothetical protein
MAEQTGRNPASQFTNLEREVSFDEVHSWITRDDEKHSADEDVEPPRHIPAKPTAQKIDQIDLMGLKLVEANSHHGCHNKYEFDWLNLRAYADNWDCLDYTTQMTVRAFVDSDLRGNNLKHGMKRRDEFHRHLLLLAGCEIWNIRPYRNTNMVLSNLKDNDGYYSWPWTKNRVIDARNCNQAGYRFLDKYDPGRLFRDFNAQIIQFEACSDYRHQPEPGWVTRSLFKSFFQKNAELLRRWGRSGLICSYIYSHEISCDSILRMNFRPHTHAVVFFKKGPIAPAFESKMQLKDRRITTTGEIHTRYETLERFIRYLFGAFSLVGVYERERSDCNLLELNRKTIQALHAILDLFKGDALESGVQRNNHSKIPLRGSW